MAASNADDIAQKLVAFIQDLAKQAPPTSEDFDADDLVIAQKLVAELVFNLIQGHAKDLLISEAEISDDRKSIERNLLLFRSSFDGLAAAIEPLRSIDLVTAFENIRGLMLASAGLGMALRHSEKARANFQTIQVGTAQKKHHEKALIRKKTQLRPAILQATKGMKLADSDKFAESIELEVWRIAGVKPDKRGFSRSTIRREVRSILQECTSTQVHS
jgi:hypothetical protein